MARITKGAAPAETTAQTEATASLSAFWAIHPKTVGLAAFSLVAVSTAGFLLSQHPSNTIPYLRYLLLAACPLMHFFHQSRHH